MKTDMQIQKDVMEELRWEPLLDSTDIGVAVKNGIVTLSGLVKNYSSKLAAEKAARRVSGVKAVAEDIQVGISPEFKRTDAEIAESILNALKWHSAIQEEKVKIKVEEGHVKLEGDVEWDYQRTSARNAIENIPGIRSVLNLITVKPRLSVTDLEKKIQSAFQRSATIDADNIIIEVMGDSVTLRGKVRSMVEKEDAEAAVWNAPGVSHVDNKLEIFEPEYSFED
jgi:osmotically-inducible protein OsmY